MSIDTTFNDPFIDTEEKEAPREKVPGETGLWAAMFFDLAFFSTFFGMWMYYRKQESGIFSQTQDTFSIFFGGANTLLLIISSWCVVMAIKHARKHHLREANQLILAAMACGFGFIAIKFFEYYAKASAGVHIDSNVFYTLYFLGTGMHFIHVLIGLSVLFLMWLRTTKDHLNLDDMRLLENGAIYWHMVDLLWIVLFPLIYLMG